MRRRASTRRGSARRWAALIFVTAGAILALYFWRAAQRVDHVPADARGRSHVQQPPDRQSAGGAEDFSAAERQGLEDILKRRGAGSRP